MMQTGSTNEENNLRDNLEAEREAVMDFLFTIVDKVSLSDMQVCFFTCMEKCLEPLEETPSA